MNFPQNCSFLRSLVFEPTKLTNFVDQWKIYSGYFCDSPDAISEIWDEDPDTQISSLAECIEHCKTFDDCGAAQFYDYTDSEQKGSLTGCLAVPYCFEYFEDGYWFNKNGITNDLAILA